MNFYMGIYIGKNAPERKDYIKDTWPSSTVP